MPKRDHDAAAQQRRHAEFCHDWRPLWDRGSRSGRHERIHATHVFRQVVQLVELLHARCLGDAAGVVAQLMREFSHLGSAVAQAGIALLRQPGMQPKDRLRFARSMAKLDRFHGNGKGFLIEYAAECMRQGKHDEACQALPYEEGAAAPPAVE